MEVVVTDSLGAPLEDARVGLDRIGITGLTDSVGELRLLNVPEGRLGITVALFGYGSDSLSVHIGRTGVHRVPFSLRPEPISVGEIHVNVRNTRRQLDVLRGFKERRERGLGFFLNREEIEARGATDLSNLLHTIPGLRTSPAQFGETSIRAMRTPVTRRCQIKVYMDGMKYRNPRDVASVATSDIEAIEVYRGRSELPAEFADIDTNCGAIVIWSRRHQDIP